MRSAARESDYLGDVTIRNSDPLLASRHRFGEVMAAAQASLGMNLGEIWQRRGGDVQDVTTDAHARRAPAPRHRVPPAERARARVHRLRRARHRSTTRWAASSTPLATAGSSSSRCSTRGCATPCTGSSSALRPRAPSSRPSAQWDAEDLERALRDEGAAVGVVRSADEWRRHPVGSRLAQKPIVELTKIGESDPIPLPAGLPDDGGPLRGINVLDCTHVIGGPITARTLAEFGANVLHISRVDYPDHMNWRLETDIGKRAAYCDLDRRRGPPGVLRLAAGRRRLHLFVHEPRPEGHLSEGPGHQQARASSPTSFAASTSRASGRTSAGSTCWPWPCRATSTRRARSTRRSCRCRTSSPTTSPATSARPRSPRRCSSGPTRAAATRCGSRSPGCACGPRTSACSTRGALDGTRPWADIVKEADAAGRDDRRPVRRDHLPAEPHRDDRRQARVRSLHTTPGVLAPDLGIVPNGSKLARSRHSDVFDDLTRCDVVKGVPPDDVGKGPKRWEMWRVQARDCHYQLSYHSLPESRARTPVQRLSAVVEEPSKERLKGFEPSTFCMASWSSAASCCESLKTPSMTEDPPYGANGNRLQATEPRTPDVPGRARMRAGVRAGYAFRTRSATTSSTPFPRSAAIRSRRFASSPSTLTTSVTRPPEPASTTCTSRGSMAATSSSKSPGCGSGALPGILRSSQLPRSIRSRSCRLPARDDHPGCRIGGPLDDKGQRPPPSVRPITSRRASSSSPVGGGRYFARSRNRLLSNAGSHRSRSSERRASRPPSAWRAIHGSRPHTAICTAAPMTGSLRAPLSSALPGVRTVQAVKTYRRCTTRSTGR